MVDIPFCSPSPKPPSPALSSLQEKQEEIPIEL